MDTVNYGFCHSPCQVVDQDSAVGIAIRYMTGRSGI